jgi:hypothetical protein
MNIITHPINQKIVLNCNYDLIGYTFFRSIRYDQELNRAIECSEHILEIKLSMNKNDSE